MAAEQKQETGPGLAGFFRDLIGSFVPAGYPELAVRPATANAMYLVGVLFLVALLLTPLLYMSSEQALSAQRESIEKAYPEDLYFESGRAVYDGKQPHVYSESIGDIRSALVIDTTGATTEPPAEYDIVTLITEDKIINVVRPLDKPAQTEKHAIPETEGRVSARQFYLDAIERNKWPGFVTALGTLFMSGLLMLFAVAGLATVVALGAEWLQRGTRLGAATCFGVVSHAATPLPFAALGVLLAPGPVWFYLLVSVPLALFIFLQAGGTQACRRALIVSAPTEQTRQKKRKTR